MQMLLCHFNRQKIEGVSGLASGHLKKTPHCIVHTLDSNPA